MTKVCIEKKVSRIVDWANATKLFEGWKPNSRSFRNRNAGNLRYTPYTKSLGAIGKDYSNFCIFPTDEIGFAALCTFLKDAASRQVKPYHVFSHGIPCHREIMPTGRAGQELPDITLLNFYEIYAPSEDNNFPKIYSKFVATKLGVPVTTLIKDLV